MAADRKLADVRQLRPPVQSGVHRLLALARQTRTMYRFRRYGGSLPPNYRLKAMQTQRMAEVRNRLPITDPSFAARLTDSTAAVIAISS